MAFCITVESCFKTQHFFFSFLLCSWDRSKAECLSDDYLTWPSKPATQKRTVQEPNKTWAVEGLSWASLPDRWIVSSVSLSLTESQSQEGRVLKGHSGTTHWGIWSPATLSPKSISPVVASPLPENRRLKTPKESSPPLTNLFVRHLCCRCLFSHSVENGLPELYLHSSLSCNSSALTCMFVKILSLNLACPFTMEGIVWVLGVPWMWCSGCMCTCELG